MRSPETMLGDSAVAVHPEDPRYKHLHGKCVVHPFNGRKLPIVTDAELVDMSFGTGAVKITPAHDPNDFATGKRHGLEFINVFTDLGVLNDNGAPYTGMKRFDVRSKVVADLEAKGLYRGKVRARREGEAVDGGGASERLLRDECMTDGGGDTF